MISDHLIIISHESRKEYKFVSLKSHSLHRLFICIAIIVTLIDVNYHNHFHEIDLVKGVDLAFPEQNMICDNDN